MNYKEGVSYTYKDVNDYTTYSSSITNPVSVLSVNTSKKALHAQHTSWINCTVSDNRREGKKALNKFLDFYYTFYNR